ncbi:RNA polymerase III subunit C82, partial [Oleoguttula sp. CCFEE 5521]
MTSSLVEVCNILVAHTFDDVSKRIFTKLANGGRTNFEILKRLHFRDTQPRRLKQSLARLIQHRLVLHYTENGDTDAERTYYSVDWHAAYGWIRNGRLLALVQERHGEKAGSLTAMLLQVGHTTVADLASAFNFEEVSGSKRNSGTEISAPHVNGNGTANVTHAPRQNDSGTIQSIDELHHILRKLLHAGILQKVGTHTFKPQADAEAEIQAVVMEEQFPDGKVTGPRKQAEFKRSADSLKRKWRDEEQYDEHRDADTNGTMKRPGQDAMSANKRRKMNGGATNGNGEVQADFSGPELPNDMSIGINHARCTVALRSEQLVHHAKQYLGHTTAGVYRALLIALEGKIRSIRDDTMVYEDEDDEDEAQPVASVLEIADQLDPNLDLTPPGKANKSSSTNGRPKVKKKGTIEYDPEFADIGIKREVASDSDDDITPIKAQGRRLDTIEQHLKLLEEHTSQFCHRPSASGSSEWRVSFPFITRTLIQSQMDTAIQRRFGT